MAQHSSTRGSRAGPLLELTRARRLLSSLGWLARSSQRHGRPTRSYEGLLETEPQVDRRSGSGTGPLISAPPPLQGLHLASQHALLAAASPVCAVSPCPRPCTCHHLSVGPISGGTAGWGISGWGHRVQGPGGKGSRCPALALVLQSPVGGACCMHSMWYIMLCVVCCVTCCV